MLPGQDDEIPTKEKWEDFVTTVSSEQVWRSVKAVKRSSAGGLQQISPWMIRLAVENSQGDQNACIMAFLVTRWAKGHFCDELGSLWSMSRLVALRKKKKGDVRPVAIGGSLKRILIRAFDYSIQNGLEQVVGGHQLGAMKAGYEVGAHLLRHETEKCKSSGWVCQLKSTNL